MKSANLLKSNKENVADRISKQLQDYFPFLEKYIKLGEQNLKKNILKNIRMNLLSSLFFLCIFHFIYSHPNLCITYYNPNLCVIYYALNHRLSRFLGL